MQPGEEVRHVIDGTALAIAVRGLRLRLLRRQRRMILSHVAKPREEREQYDPPSSDKSLSITGLQPGTARAERRCVVTSSDVRNLPRHRSTIHFDPPTHTNSQTTPRGCPSAPVDLDVDPMASPRSLTLAASVRRMLERKQLVFVVAILFESVNGHIIKANLPVLICTPSQF
ncbi:hypothetical protein BS17DRAFT_818533 [Gyrodon lividus]|nr:hypothetical protein BS17DRAFT_818533 [Gyrodon lividus]